MARIVYILKENEIKQFLMLYKRNRYMFWTRNFAKKKKETTNTYDDRIANDRNENSLISNNVRLTVKRIGNDRINLYTMRFNARYKQANQ